MVKGYLKKTTTINTPEEIKHAKAWLHKELSNAVGGCYMSEINFRIDEGKVSGYYIYSK